MLEALPALKLARRKLFRICRVVSSSMFSGSFVLTLIPALNLIKHLNWFLKKTIH